MVNLALGISSVVGQRVSNIQSLKHVFWK